MAGNPAPDLDTLLSVYQDAWQERSERTVQFTLLGYCTLIGHVLAIVAVVGTLLLTYPPTIVREERHLRQRFPHDWPRYARVVPAFIPRLPRGLGPVSGRRWLANREYQAAIGGPAGTASDTGLVSILGKVTAELLSGLLIERN